jgi:CTP:molybdopterin cytidylyltransferase MocA
MIFAVVPAAGLSTRMGLPKLALPLGGKTVLERVVGSLTSAGVDQILVVLGPHGTTLAPLARQAGADVLVLQGQTPDMRTTVEQGLRWLSERFHPKPHDHWLLVPADHPLLDPGVVQNLITRLAQRPNCSIAVPILGGRRGHPTLLSWNHALHLPAHPAGQGINTYLHRHQAETLEVTVAVESILLDLDTPGDYRELLKGRRSKERSDS